MIKPSINKSVLDVVKAHVAANGEAWILGLGYAACNDYAEAVKNIVSINRNEYMRFETVARYIRTYKDGLKKTPTTPEGV